MRIAKDGKPFDIPNDDLVQGKNEVEVIQHMYPDGQRRCMLAPADPETVKKSAGMILSSEILTTGDVALYARFCDEDEEDEMLELAHNGPDTKDAMSPKTALKKLVACKYAERKESGS